MRQITCLILWIFLCSGCRTVSPMSVLPDIQDDPSVAQQEFTLTLSGRDGLAVSGIIKTEAETREIVVNLPYECNVKSRNLLCTFNKLDWMGELVLVVSEGETERGSASTKQIHGGVKGEIIRTGENKHSLFTSF